MAKSFFKSAEIRQVKILKFTAIARSLLTFNSGTINKKPAIRFTWNTFREPEKMFQH